VKAVCFIPARGGSVRIPRKNIRMFHGKPIIAYSIDNALKCGLFDEVIVSTDDDEIANVAAKYGAQYVRRDPDDGTRGTQELAGEYLRTQPRVGMCCVLYPCAPLIEWPHLTMGLKCLMRSRHDLFAHSVTGDADVADIGGFYWGHAQAFRDNWPLSLWSKPVPITLNRCCDINEESDWIRAERMYEEMHRGD
jgi:pseudaminic acid cytidylyltransferase